MKKYIALFLAVVMVLCLFAGCGSKPAETAAPAASGAAPAAAPAASGGSTTAAPAASGGAAAPAAAPSGKVEPIVDAEGARVFRLGVDDLGRFVEGLAPSESYPMCTLIYDAIFRIDPYTKQVVSDCLQDWYWEDEHHFVMKLRDDVYFSNGQKATSEDLLYSYTNHSPRGSNYTSNYNIDFDKCENRDDLTTVLYCTTATLSLTRTVSFHLYCKDWCEEVGWDSEEWYNPVTSGPYKVLDFKYGDEATIGPRDDYWNKDAEPAYIDKFYVKQYSDAEAMMMDLELGNLDLCQATSADYSRYINDPNKDNLDYVVYNDPTGAVEYVSFGLADFPELWMNKDARLAIAHGVDWESVGMLINQDMYQPANGLVPDYSPYFLAGGKYEYDPELAKEYMAKSGLNPATKTIKMIIMNTGTYNAFAEAVQFYMADLGFKTDFQAADISAALAAWMNPGSCDFNLFWNNSGNIPLDVPGTMSTSNMKTGCVWQNISNSDPKFGELYGRAMDPMISDEERVQANYDMAQYVYDECLGIPVAQFSTAFAYNKNTLTEKIVDAITFSNRYQLIGCYQESAWEK